MHLWLPQGFSDASALHPFYAIFLEMGGASHRQMVFLFLLSLASPNL